MATKREGFITSVCKFLRKAKRPWRIWVSLTFFAYVSIALRFGFIQWAKDEDHDPTDPILYHELWANIFSAWWLGLLHGCRDTDTAKRYRALHQGMAAGVVGSFASWQLSMALALTRASVAFRLYLLGLLATLSFGLTAFYIGVHMMMLWCWMMRMLRPMERLAYLRRKMPVKRTTDLELQKSATVPPLEETGWKPGHEVTLPPAEAAEEMKKENQPAIVEEDSGSQVVYHVLLILVEASTTAFVVCLFAAPRWKGLWFSFLCAPLACWFRYWLLRYNTRFALPLFTLSLNFIGSVICATATIIYMAVENEKFPGLYDRLGWDDPALYLLPAIATGLAGSLSTFSTFLYELVSLSLVKTYLYGLGTLVIVQLTLLLIYGIYDWTT